MRMIVSRLKDYENRLREKIGRKRGVINNSVCVCVGGGGGGEMLTDFEKIDRLT